MKLPGERAHAHTLIGKASIGERIDPRPVPLFLLAITAQNLHHSRAFDVRGSIAALPGWDRQADQAPSWPGGLEGTAAARASLLTELFNRRSLPSWRLTRGVGAMVETFRP